MRQPKDIDWLGKWKHIPVCTSTYHITLLELYVIFVCILICKLHVILKNIIRLIKFPLSLEIVIFFYFFFLLLIVKADKHLLLLWLRVSQSLQSCLFVTPWTIAHQATLSMVFSRQEYWSGLPSKVSSWPRDQTCISYVSFISRQVLYHWCHLASPSVTITHLISFYQDWSTEK